MTLGKEDANEIPERAAFTKHRQEQLETNSVEAAVLERNGDWLRVQRGDEHAAYSKMIEELEPELFAQAIKLAQGNQAKAARWLGVTRLKMREKLIQLGLHRVSGEAEE